MTGALHQRHHVSRTHTESYHDTSKSKTFCHKQIQRTHTHSTTTNRDVEQQKVHKIWKEGLVIQTNLEAPLSLQDAKQWKRIPRQRPRRNWTTSQTKWSQ